jgi:chorismate dehydratase
MDGTVGQERIAHDAGATSPMKLAKDQIVKIIRDAGKIPVERDVYYNPLAIHAGNVVGKIPYLNSVPFYRHFEKRGFKILPIVPRRMGILEKKGEIIAGLFSLMDYFRREAELELFSKGGWLDLEKKTIGVTDDTATSVRLLQVLLEKKYGVTSTFERMHAGVNDVARFDAVLLIGDEALLRNKHGLPGFELVFDLAREWYDWKKMPFVFAVWAVRRSLPAAMKEELASIIEQSLTAAQGEFGEIGESHGRRIGLTKREVEEYLEGFNYRLGDRALEAMREFRKLVLELEEITIH